MRKIKRGGGFGRWPAYEVVTDEYGRWLYSPKGTVYRGHEPSGRMVEIEVGQVSRAEGVPVMHLIPTDQWWLAWWYELDGVRRISVDICTPPKLVEGEWTFVDLELDPQWSSVDGVSLEDEDEFDTAVEAEVIRPDEAAQARATADDVIIRLRDGVEPFGDVGWARFQDALASELEPIHRWQHAMQSAWRRVQS